MANLIKRASIIPPARRERAGSRRRFRLVMTLCVLAGLALGRLVWHHIRIPLGETYGIVSPAVRSGFNPLNNFLRTAAFALLPPLLFFLCYWLNWGALRSCFQRCLLWENDIRPNGRTARTNFAGFVLTLVFALLLAVNLWGSRELSFDWFHDGESLSAGLSYTQGQAPYKDFLFVHGLLQDPGRAALAFTMFGKSIGSLRSVDHLARAIILLLTATFLWQIYRGRLEWVLLTLVSLAGLMAGTAIGGEKLPLGPVLIQMRELPTLLFLNLGALIARRLEDGKGSHRVAALLMFGFGFLPGASFLVSVDRGLFLTATMLVGLPLVLSGLARSLREMCKLLASAAAGLGAGVVVLLAVLGPGAREFLWYLTVYLPKYHVLIVGEEYPIQSPAFLDSQVMLAALTCCLAALALTHFSQRPARLAEAWRTFCQRRYLEVTMVATSAIWFSIALTQADTWHLRLATLPMYLSLFYLIIRYVFNPLVARAGKTQLGSRLGWVCTLFLVLACAGRLIGGGLIPNWLPVAVPDRRVVPEQMQAVADYLKSVMGPRDAFFATDSNSSWYYLTGRPCPARYPIAYLAAPTACQREIIQSLKSRKVRFALTTAGKDADVRASLLSRRSLRLLNGHIASAYNPLRRIGDVQIWERAASGSE